MTETLPWKELKATIKPNGTPIRLAKTVDIQLTFSDTPTMTTISASREITSRMAEIKLSTRRSMGVVYI